MFDTLVLSSGGNYCSTYIGALKALENFQSLDKIKKFIGCSGGGLIAFLIIIGYKPIELIKIIYNYNLNNLFKVSIFKFFSKFGFNDFKDLNNLIISLFLIKKININITFLELKKKMNKSLILIGSNISKKKISIFSYKKKPNMKILDALRITCSIPFMFEPVKIDGDLYVDGAIFCSFPIYLSNSNKTLGFKLKNSKNENFKINNLKDYILMFPKLINKKKNKNKNNNIINFNLKSKKLSFILNNSEIKTLISEGYRITNIYLFKKKKKIRLLRKYFYLIKKYK